MSILKVVNPGKTIKNVEKCRRDTFGNSVFGPMCVCFVFLMILRHYSMVFEFCGNILGFWLFLYKINHVLVKWLCRKTMSKIIKNHQKITKKVVKNIFIFTTIFQYYWSELMMFSWKLSLFWHGSYFFDWLNFTVNIESCKTIKMSKSVKGVL